MRVRKYHVNMSFWIVDGCGRLVLFLLTEYRQGRIGPNGRAGGSGGGGGGRLLLFFLKKCRRGGIDLKDGGGGGRGIDLNDGGGGGGGGGVKERIRTIFVG